MTTLSIAVSFSFLTLLICVFKTLFTCHFPQNIHYYSVSKYRLTALLTSIVGLLCLLFFYSIYLSLLSTFFGHNLVIKKKKVLGTSVVIQWLRHHVSTTGAPVWIPGRGTKILHAMWHSQIN